MVMMMIRDGDYDNDGNGGGCGGDDSSNFLARRTRRLLEASDRNPPSISLVRMICCRITDDN